jgi:hypothetical protein
MADYYPLIARAVSALEPNMAEARQNIYERARTALTRQLASIDPPPAGDIIDREIAALEAVIRRIEGENAAARPVPVAATAPSSAAAEPSAVNPPGDELKSPPARPQAPARQHAKPNRKPIYAVGGAVALVVVMAIATLAFLRRNEPPAMASQRPGQTAQPTAAASAPPAKLDERISSGQPEAAPVRPQPPAQTPAQPQRPSTPAAPAPAAPPAMPAPAQPAIAVANRLVMAMEGLDRPENVVVRQGSVVWRTEMVSGGQGQPPQLAIKAMLDAPDARIRAEMTIQRNRDPAFPASHTIQVQFTPAQGSEFGAVRNLAQIELRQTENQAGYPLAGQGIAVVENVFLLALAQIEPALSRNVEMLKNRPLLYLEFQNAAGRRGLMVFEKGVSGQQAFEDAFRSWQ